MDDRTRQLVAELQQHAPLDAKEQRDVALTLRYLTWLAAPFDPARDPTHVTASAIVFNPDGEVLVHRHKRLGILLQPGGHVEGTERPHDAAQRELHEETGVVAGDGTFVHIDIHQGPRGHVHLDLRYRFHTADHQVLTPAAGESRHVLFILAAQLARDTDASLQRAVRAAHLKD